MATLILFVDHALDAWNGKSIIMYHKMLRAHGRTMSNNRCATKQAIRCWTSVNGERFLIRTENILDDAAISCRSDVHNDGGVSYQPYYDRRRKLLQCPVFTESSSLPV